MTVNGSIPPKNIASISNSGDVSCNTLTATNEHTKSYIDASLNTNYYTKSYIDTSLNTNYYTKSVIDSQNANNYISIMEQIDASRCTKSQSDAKYYSKSYIDAGFGAVYTKTQSDTNYYNKRYIDTSFGAVNTEINEIKSSGGTTGNFTGDIRVAGKINVGQDNPAGTGVLRDTANIQYVGYGSPNSGQTVLRINFGGDDITSGSQDNINLNLSGGVGINNDNPNYSLDVSVGTKNTSTGASLLNFKASNPVNENFVGISAYLNAGSYNGLVQNADSAIIYNADQTTHGLCIFPQTSYSKGVRLDENGNGIIMNFDN